MTGFILHVGDGKCGSSSIQASLYKARHQLLDKGLIYEPASPTAGHFSLTTLIGEKTRGDDELQRAQAQRTVERIRSTLSAARAHQVLLSAESFFSLSPERIFHICNMISPDVSSLKVIAYVRPPESMYVSLVQQALKGDHLFPLPHKYKRPIDVYLAQWSSLVGEDNLSVGVFERTRLLGEDVITDFAERLHTLAGIRAELDRAEANVSLTAEQLVVLQKMRAAYFSNMRWKRCPQSDALVRMFIALNGSTPLGQKLTLKPQARCAIRKMNAGIVERVNLFLGGQVIVPEAFDGDVEFDASAFRADDVRTILQNYDAGLIALLEDVFLRWEGEDSLPTSHRRLNALRQILGVHNRCDFEVQRAALFKYFEQIGKSEECSRLFQ